MRFYFVAVTFISLLTEICVTEIKDQCWAKKEIMGELNFFLLDLEFIAFLELFHLRYLSNI